MAFRFEFINGCVDQQFFQYFNFVIEIGGDVVVKILAQMVQDLISLIHAVPIRQSSEESTLSFLTTLKQRIQGNEIN
jgi:hypothetical protein